MSKKDWTEQLPEALSGYSEAEPEGLWDAVQAGLAAAAAQSGAQAGTEAAVAPVPAASAQAGAPVSVASAQAGADAAAAAVPAAEPRSRRVAAFWWWTASAALAAACVAALVLLRPVAEPEGAIAVRNLAEAGPVADPVAVPVAVPVADVPPDVAVSVASEATRDGAENDVPVAVRSFESSRPGAALVPSEATETDFSSRLDGDTVPRQSASDGVSSRPDGDCAESPVSQPGDKGLLDEATPSENDPSITESVIPVAEPDVPEVDKDDRIVPDESNEAGSAPVAAQDPTVEMDDFGTDPDVRPSVQTKLSLGAFSGWLLANGPVTQTRGFGLPGAPMRMASGGGISPMMMARNKPSTTSARHDGGISYGLTLTIHPWLHRPGWERLGFETGLLLTPLVSEITTEAGNVTEETSRKMRYLGVPLFVHYNFLRFGSAYPLQLYAVGGPMYEWSVRTHTETVRRIGDYVADSTDVSANIRSSFWSLHAALGIQWTLFPGRDPATGGALFLQGGLGYHFDPGTDLQNAFTEHPFAPTLTFGLRFSF